MESSRAERGANASPVRASRRRGNQRGGTSGSPQGRDQPGSHEQAAAEPAHRPQPAGPEAAGRGAREAVRDGQNNGKTFDDSQQKRQNFMNYSILYANIRSILNKLLVFKAYVYDKKPDVICLCETFLRPEITNAQVSLDGYQCVVRQDGNDTISGKCRGLLIY